MTDISFEEIAALADQLSAIEKIRLVERLAVGLEQELEEDKPQPRRSLYGIWEGVSVSEEDIDEIRREMWSNFPREDIG